MERYVYVDKHFICRINDMSESELINFREELSEKIDVIDEELNFRNESKTSDYVSVNLEELYNDT